MLKNIKATKWKPKLYNQSLQNIKTTLRFSNILESKILSDKLCKFNFANLHFSKGRVKGMHKKVKSKVCKQNMSRSLLTDNYLSLFLHGCFANRQLRSLFLQTRNNWKYQCTQCKA